MNESEGEDSQGFQGQRWQGNGEKEEVLWSANMG